jgi:hypothetical protein
MFGATQGRSEQAGRGERWLRSGLAVAGVLLALTGPLLLAGHGSGHAHDAPAASTTAGAPLIASTADHAATPCALCEFLAGSQRTAVLASAPAQAMLPAPAASVPIASARQAPAPPLRSLENPRAPPIAL